MTYKNNIAPGSRTFYVSPNGNDAESGLSPETAVLTIQEAIDLANALIPPPSSDPADFTAIQLTGAGQFIESGLVFPVGCQVNAENTFLFPDGAGVTPGSTSAMNIGVALITAAGETVYDLTNKETIGVNGLAAITFGDNSHCMHVGGTCKELSVTMDQFRVGGVGSIGLLNTCEDDDVFIGKIDNIILNSNDTVGIMQSHATLNLMKSALSIIAITEEVDTSLTGTIGIDIQRGESDILIANIDAETAIHVGSGASLNITCSSAVGAIIIDAGGIMHCEIPGYSGVITNNGTIHGRLGDTIFGSQEFQDGIDMITTDDALRLPRLTTSERDALTPLSGMLIFNTTTLETEEYNGTAWVGSSGAGVNSVTAGSNLNNSGTASDPVLNLDNTITSTAAGGDLTLKGAAGNPTGGDVTLIAGDGSNNGGSLKFNTGYGNSGSGGNVEFVTSEGTNGSGGKFSFSSGNGASE